MTQYTARPATRADLSAVVDGARAYVEENEYGVIFDRSIAESTLSYYIAESSTDVLVVVLDGEVAGAAVVAADWDFAAQPFGHLLRFYILKAHRRTEAGRVLIAACVDWFDARGCVECWAAATAGIGQDGAFVSLVRKVGFAPVGPTLRRTKGHS